MLGDLVCTNLSSEAEHSTMLAAGRTLARDPLQQLVVVRQHGDVERRRAARSGASAAPCRGAARRGSRQQVPAARAAELQRRLVQQVGAEERAVEVDHERDRPASWIDAVAASRTSIAPGGQWAPSRRLSEIERSSG